MGIVAITGVAVNQPAGVRRGGKEKRRSAMRYDFRNKASPARCNRPRAGDTRLMARRALDISKLTPAERLQLVEELWESLCDTPDVVPLTDAQRAELDRRLDELEKEEPTGIPWDEVVERIRTFR
jgi:putative addiction module component (TIGR02574 family)